MTGKFYPGRQGPGSIASCRSSTGTRAWPDIARSARQALHCCVRGLSMLSSSTEDEFIMIAETLEDVSRQTRKAPASAGGVELNVEDVVTLIQFHDITRQQFERSSAACRAMIKKLAAADSGRPETAPGQKSGGASAEELARFCVCQAKAIEETRETFVASVTRLIRKIGLIADEIRKTAGNGADAGIETAVHGICVHKFVNIVAEEVLSALNDLRVEMRPFVPEEMWEKITVSSGRTETATGGETSGIGTDISSETGSSLGDNVQLF